MKIKTLSNISKKESFLFYRNEYNADAVFIYGSSNTEETVPVIFCVEKTATGSSVITAEILRHINYPMMGASSQLKQYISELEKRGKLP